MIQKLLVVLQSHCQRVGLTVGLSTVSIGMPHAPYFITDLQTPSFICQVNSRTKKEGEQCAKALYAIHLGKLGIIKTIPFQGDEQNYSFQILKSVQILEGKVYTSYTEKCYDLDLAKLIKEQFKFQFNGAYYDMYRYGKDLNITCWSRDKCTEYAAYLLVLEKDPEFKIQKIWNEPCVIGSQSMILQAILNKSQIDLTSMFQKRGIYSKNYLMIDVERLPVGNKWFIGDLTTSQFIIVDSEKLPKIPNDAILLIKDASQDVIHHPELLSYPIVEIGKFQTNYISFPLLTCSSMKMCMELRLKFSENDFGDLVPFFYALKIQGQNKYDTPMNEGCLQRCLNIDDINPTTQLKDIRSVGNTNQHRFQIIDYETHYHMLYNYGQNKDSDNLFIATLNNLKPILGKNSRARQEEEEEKIGKGKWVKKEGQIANSDPMSQTDKVEQILKKKNLELLQIEEEEKEELKEYMNLQKKESQIFLEATTVQLDRIHRNFTDDITQFSHWQTYRSALYPLKTFSVIMPTIDTGMCFWVSLLLSSPFTIDYKAILQDFYTQQPVVYQLTVDLERSQVLDFLHAPWFMKGQDNSLYQRSELVRAHFQGADLGVTAFEMVYLAYIFQVNIISEMGNMDLAPEAKFALKQKYGQSMFDHMNDIYVNKPRALFTEKHRDFYITPSIYATNFKGIQHCFAYYRHGLKSNLEFTYHPIHVILRKQGYTRTQIGTYLYDKIVDFQQSFQNLSAQDYENIYKQAVYNGELEFTKNMIDYFCDTQKTALIISKFFVPDNQDGQNQFFIFGQAFEHTTYLLTEGNAKDDGNREEFQINTITVGSHQVTEHLDTKVFYQGKDMEIKDVVKIYRNFQINKRKVHNIQTQKEVSDAIAQDMIKAANLMSIEKSLQSNGMRLYTSKNNQKSISQLYQRKPEDTEQQAEVNRFEVLRTDILIPTIKSYFIDHIDNIVGVQFDLLEPMDLVDYVVLRIIEHVVSYNVIEEVMSNHVHKKATKILTQFFKMGSMKSVLKFLMQPLYQLRADVISLNGNATNQQISKVTSHWSLKKFSIYNGSIVDYSLVLQMPPQALDLIKYHFGDCLKFNMDNIKKLEKKCYGHAVLRTLVDLMTTITLSNIKPLFADIGSKFHKISRIYKRRFLAFRAKFAPFDSTYLRQHTPEEQVMLCNQLVTADTRFEQHVGDILSIDSIYYPGVLECILSNLKREPTRTARVIFNAYTDKQGTYNLNYNEGNFTIFEKEEMNEGVISKKKFVCMRPSQNGDPYEHALFDWDYSVFHNKADKGFIYTTKYHIPTSSHSALILMEIHYDPAFRHKKYTAPQPISLDTSLIFTKTSTIDIQKYVDLAYSYYTTSEKSFNETGRQKAFNYICHQLHIKDASSVEQEQMHNAITIAQEKFANQLLVNRKICQQLQAAYLDTEDTIYPDDFIRKLGGIQYGPKEMELLFKEYQAATGETSWNTKQIENVTMVQDLESQITHKTSILSKTLDFVLNIPVLSPLVQLSKVMNVMHIDDFDVKKRKEQAQQKANLSGKNVKLARVNPLDQMGKFYGRKRLLGEGHPFAQDKVNLNRLQATTQANQLEVIPELYSNIETNENLTELKLFKPNGKKFNGTVQQFFPYLKKIQHNQVVEYYNDMMIQRLGEETQQNVMAVNYVNSAFGILARHTTSKLFPDEEIVQQLADSVKESLSHDSKSIPHDFQYIQWDEYFDQLDPKKKPLYKSGYEFFQKEHRLVNSYDLIQKAHEFHSKKHKDIKPRNIFNPHMSIKAILGWINFNLIKIQKRVDKKFIHGKNTGDLSKFIEERVNMRHFQKPVFLMWDGSNFDAHQHHTLIKAVDLQYVEKYLKDVCMGIGMTYNQYTIVKQSVEDLTVDIKMYYPGFTKQKLMMTAKLTGTTFTGSPLFTTWGNTNRMKEYTRLIYNQNLYLNKPIQLHAGDDVLTIQEESDVQHTLDAMKKLSLTDPPKETTKYGLGQIFRDFYQSSTNFEFLARNGVRMNTQVTMKRKIQRVLLGSHLTKSVPTNLTPSQYHQAVTIGLQAYVKSDSQVKDYIEQRRERLIHDNMTIKQIDDYENSYSYQTHINDRTPLFNSRILLTLAPHTLKANFRDINTEAVSQ